MSLRDTIMRLLGGKATTPTSVGQRRGLRGCPEEVYRVGATFEMCALSKGHTGDHLPSVRPAHGARV